MHVKTLKHEKKPLLQRVKVNINFTDNTSSVK